ncbi:MotA/TolQ/ExbB proton channel family protein [Palleniella muris]|uniref:MotA/TolQ/ExbB proton channel family protein n=1 Tax=Palleniella muris TaxID=3038145 RepID=A0AC61QSX7_9BACT|nr:MotA/TolQ/ExbB proton channel family protein [Palleniella muris]TGX83551.1 MotA/TolQ/ExbB proton channel family protein [Palleniella muris]
MKTIFISLLADESMHQVLKAKFIEGNPLFMSFVAIALIIGLTFCIERIIYLALADINTKKFLSKLEELYKGGDKEAALDFCRNTRGPVASICFQGLLHSEDTADDIERTITSYADLELAKLEKGCSWITLFIAIAPSLGFLGTVIGMVMAFDDIEMAGDISPTIVAGGMKVALITTIFGIISAVVLQIFYNYILSRIEHLTSQMEQAAIELIEILRKQ